MPFISHDAVRLARYLDRTPPDGRCTHAEHNPPGHIASSMAYFCPGCWRVTSPPPFKISAEISAVVDRIGAAMGHAVDTQRPGYSYDGTPPATNPAVMIRDPAIVAAFREPERLQMDNADDEPRPFIVGG